MKQTLVFFSLLWLISCQNAVPPVTTFADRFANLNWKDTLTFAVAPGLGTEAPLASADTVFLDTFYHYLPANLRTTMNNIQGDPEVVVKIGKFPLDELHDALAVDTKTFWFRSQALLIWDKSKRQVIGYQPVTEYYGGDGGQLLGKSWLLKDAQENPELICRFSEVQVRFQPEKNDVEEIYTESVQRFIWQDGSFVAQATPDSLELIRRFSVSWD